MLKLPLLLALPLQGAERTSAVHQVPPPSAKASVGQALVDQALAVRPLVDQALAIRPLVALESSSAGAWGALPSSEVASSVLVACPSELLVAASS